MKEHQTTATTYYRARARELRELARRIALLGLPSVQTSRTSERLRQIASEIERGPRMEMG